MGWQDRDYNQTNFRGGRAGSLFFKIFFGSVPLGTWFGIRVRVHATLIFFIIGTLIYANLRGGLPLKDALTDCVMLFGIILLHEFGHCFACRMVGGTADDILMWPLGGLAFCDPPHRPWPTFVTAAGGPLVNVIICLITGGILLAMTHFQGHLPLNPLLPFGGGDDVVNDHAFSRLLSTSTTAFYLAWVYAISYMLLVFNLLPIFPLDGGRILQSILWPIMGFYKSMNFACITGMIGAALGAMYAIATFNLWLIVLAYSGFITCFFTRAELLANGPGEYQDAVDYSAAYESPNRHHHKKVKRGWFKTAKRRASRDQQEQAKIDAILAKVHDRGIHSLSWWEKRILRKATERQRRRDLAERY